MEPLSGAPPRMLRSVWGKRDAPTPRSPVKTALLDIKSVGLRRPDVWVEEVFMREVGKEGECRTFG